MSVSQISLGSQNTIQPIVCLPNACQFKDCWPNVIHPKAFHPKACQQNACLQLSNVCLQNVSHLKCRLQNVSPKIVYYRMIVSQMSIIK